MKRSGFKRKTYERAPQPLYAPMDPSVAARVKMGPVEAAAPVPKSEPQRNARLLSMARGMPCLLALPCCNHDTATTVAAHSNQAKHGKAGARKADDQYSVWACFACHNWLDQGSAPQEEKTEAWGSAYERQVISWRAIADSHAYPEADRRAARWALERVSE